MADIVRKSSLIFLETGVRQKGSLLVAVHSYTLPYIMHFMHLCYAKEAWWKEFHHWALEFQLPLLFPVVISAAGGAALHTGGKSPPFPPRRADVLGLFIFHVPLLCSRGMGREMLRGAFRAVKPVQFPSKLTDRAAPFHQLIGQMTFTINQFTVQPVRCQKKKMLELSSQFPRCLQIFKLLLSMTKKHSKSSHWRSWNHQETMNGWLK